MLSFPANLLKINKQYQTLYFYGTRHCYDKSDKQFSDIAFLWEQFIQEAKGEKIAFGEVPIPIPLPDDLSDTIANLGEAGAHYWHARKYAVTLACPEPTPTEQRTELCAAFSPKEVFYALTIQNLAGWFRNNRNRTFDEAITFTITREAAYSDIYSFIPTRDLFFDLHSQLFAKQPLENQDFLQRLADPRRTDNQINRIIGKKTEFRNNHIIERIQQETRAGKSLFIVYGLGHFETLRNQLLNNSEL